MGALVEFLLPENEGGVPIPFVCHTLSCIFCTLYFLLQFLSY